MSAACSVISKDFFFYVVFHICTGFSFCLADLSPVCGFQKERGEERAMKNLGAFLPGRK